MKFVHFGRLLFLVVTLCLGAQLSVVASALVPSAESAWIAASRAWSRIPARGTVPQRGYQTSQIAARVQQAPETTVRVEPRTTAARYYAATRSMSTGRSGMGFGPMAGRSVGRYGAQAQKTPGQGMWVRSFFSATEEPKPKGILSATGRTITDRGILILSREDLEDMINRRKGSISSWRYGPIDLRKYSLKNVDLSGLIFPSGTRFERVNLTGANLTGAHIPNGNFDEAVLTNTTLDKADLTGCTFWHTEFHDTSARGTNFTNAVFTYPYYKYNMFDDTDFTNANFTNATLKENVLLTDAATQGAIFNGTTIRGTVDTPLYARLPSEVKNRGVGILLGSFKPKIKEGKIHIEFERYGQGSGFQYEKGPRFQFVEEEEEDLGHKQEKNKQHKERTRQGGQPSKEMLKTKALAFFELESGATQNDIKRAYRAYVHKWHPDKFATASEKDQKIANSMMSKGNEAYEILTKNEAAVEDVD